MTETTTPLVLTPQVTPTPTDFLGYARSPTDRLFQIDQQGIELRNNLAKGLGFVLADRCAFGVISGHGGNFKCWERMGKGHLYQGVLAPSYHCIHMDTHRDGIVEYIWPEDVNTAAWALDHGVMEGQKKAVYLKIPAKKISLK